MIKSQHSKLEKGHGLIVVITTLTLLGLIIGGIFSIINNSLSDVGGDGDVAAAPALLWGTDNIYNKAEVCNSAGVPSGGMVYLWTENASMQNGDAFYWTESSTAPVSGYYLMSSTVCP
jgi:tetrahydromethanopterin S-methyltransferase subunit C